MEIGKHIFIFLPHILHYHLQRLFSRIVSLLVDMSVFYPRYTLEYNLHFLKKYVIID